MENNYCVFIGRFQPFHKAHLQVLQQALSISKEVIVVVGSSKCARNTKNPWTFDERRLMILHALGNDVGTAMKRLHFIDARDYHYNDTFWVTEIQQKVNAITRGDSNVCMIGSYKDASSYYLKYFPQWEFIHAKTDKSLNATDVRNRLLTSASYDPEGDNELSSHVAKWLNAHMANNHDVYNSLREEFAHINSYKQQWAQAPFPVTFNTADAVVIQSGHILVVKRRFNPGKGLYALPGGFLKQTETLEAGAIRELKEETGIKVHAQELKKHIIESRVFDYPERSLRGRTITTAFCVKLPDGELPEVKGSDDAETAVWMPLMDALSMEEKFFEDHAHIIRYFVNRF